MTARGRAYHILALYLGLNLEFVSPQQVERALRRVSLITIGLTGGIASGKSVVSQMLAQRGAKVVDVDRVAHETYRPGTTGFDQLRAAFGEQVVDASGEIDRRVLGGLVFGRPDQMKKLTNIVWPLTRARLEQMKRDEALATAVLVLEAAVLIEANWVDLVDEVWVVSVPVEVAKARLMTRNGISAEQADARIGSQITNDERERFAQVIIDNSGSLHDLEERVDDAWTRLGVRSPAK